jgi:hypothetical protein
VIGVDSDPEHDPSIPERLKRYVELVGGITAVLATLGYISLRARLNFLGIGAVADIELQRLLFEVYSFLISALEILLFFCAPLLLVFGMLCAALQLYKRHRGWTYAPLPFVSQWVVPSIMVLPPVAAMAIIFVVLSQPSLFREAVLVQRLSGLAALEQNWFVFPIVLLAALALTCWLGSHTVAQALGKFAGFGLAKIIRVFSAGLLALLGWMSAIVFSTQFQGLHFQEIVLSDSKAGRLECGLLVMATAKDLYLWKMEGSLPIARGVIVMRSRAPDLSMRLGPVTDMKAFALGPQGDQFCTERGA